jgi:hypothetical protein
MIRALARSLGETLKHHQSYPIFDILWPTAKLKENRVYLMWLRGFSIFCFFFFNPGPRYVDPRYEGFCGQIWPFLGDEKKVQFHKTRRISGQSQKQKDPLATLNKTSLAAPS